MTADTLELSKQGLAFTGNLLDPQSETRDDKCLAQALSDPRVRLLAIQNNHLFLDTNGNAWMQLSQAPDIQLDLSQAIFLGNDPAGPVVAAPSGADRDDPPAGFAAVPFRALFVEGLVDAAVLGAVAQGASLARLERQSPLLRALRQRNLIARRRLPAVLRLL